MRLFKIVELTNISKLYEKNRQKFTHHSCSMKSMTLQVDDRKYHIQKIIKIPHQHPTLYLIPAITQQMRLF